MFLIIYEYIKWDKGVYKKHGLLKNKKDKYFVWNYSNGICKNFDGMHIILIGRMHIILIGNLGIRNELWYNISSKIRMKIQEMILWKY